VCNSAPYDARKSSMERNLMRGGLMVCGTTSDAGKSTVVAGLCRLLARQGLKVAPFEAQNMALNSFVTPAGHEIGRAQGVQALAAGVEPDVAMNPILLKPTGERTSQVVVMGRPVAHMDAAAYHDHKPHLVRVVLDALDSLRSRYDVPVIGVLPYVHDIGLDAEDSLALSGPRPEAYGSAVADRLDVAAIRFPRLANFTDLDALAIEPGVGVRLVDSPAAVGRPDL